MLNTEQKQAVECTANKILVLAGAGTGKTTTMLSRISHLIDTGISASAILVLTFTNAAACEMKERYRKSHVSTITPMFCTFHSYCYSLLAKNKEVAASLEYYRDTPEIADESVLKRIHTTCKQQCGTKLSDDKLNGKVPLKPNEKFPYQLFWKQYEKLMQKENLISFDKMCYGVSSLFVNDNPIINSEKSQYQYVFVDEFQDTDPRQWEFVSSFTHSNLFVVGDAKQAIYQFRNGDSKIIKSLAENPDWTVLRLSENYRSTEQICDYANRIHSTWQGQSYNLEIHGQKDGLAVLERPPLQLWDSHEFLHISDDAQHMHTAVLSRTNYEANQIKEKFRLYNIPFYEKKADTSISGILKSATDSAYCVDWLSSQLPMDAYTAYLKYCAADSKYKEKPKFFELYQNQFAEQILMIQQIRIILESDQTPYQKIFAISKLLYIPLNGIELVTDNAKSIIDFLISAANSEGKKDGVYVGTIHSVKGLEFDCVHLVGVNGKAFLIDKDEEQQNLFYIGCTRAKEKLVIYNQEK